MLIYLYFQVTVNPPNRPPDATAMDLTTGDQVNSLLPAQYKFKYSCEVGGVVWSLVFNKSPGRQRDFRQAGEQADGRMVNRFAATPLVFPWFPC